MNLLLFGSDTTTMPDPSEISVTGGPERRVLFDAAHNTTESDELLEGGAGRGAGAGRGGNGQPEIAAFQTGRPLASAEPPESFISSSSMSGG